MSATTKTVQAICMITDDQSPCPVTASVPIKALLCRVEKGESYEIN